MRAPDRHIENHTRGITHQNRLALSLLSVFPFAQHAPSVMRQSLESRLAAASSSLAASSNKNSPGTVHTTSSTTTTSPKGSPFRTVVHRRSTSLVHVDGEVRHGGWKQIEGRVDMLTGPYAKARQLALLLRRPGSTVCVRWSLY